MRVCLASQLKYQMASLSMIDVLISLEMKALELGFQFLQLLQAFHLLQDLRGFQSSLFHLGQSLVINVLSCTQILRQFLFFISCSSNGNSIKTHLGSKLNSKMSKSSHSKNSNYIAYTCSTIPKSIVCSDTSTHKRCSLYSGELLG